VTDLNPTPALGVTDPAARPDDAAPLLLLHGTPRVRVAAHDERVLSAREAALLAWLHLQGSTPRATLAGLLWPAGDDAKARANLRQTLLRLKRGIGELLAETGAGLRLAPGVEVAAAGPGERLLGPLEFDDAPELAAWLEERRAAEQRNRLRERLSAARGALAAAGDDTRQLDAALAAADAVLADDAAVEEAHRIRMEVFFRRADRASAIEAWDSCRHALRSAYGIAPSAATNALGRRILAAGGASEADTPGGNAIPASFEHPPQLIGRDAVLADIEAALARGHGVVVAGPGGIGKSRVLAAAVQRFAAGASVAIGGRPGDEHLPGVVASRLVAAAIERFDPELDATTRADIRRLLPGDVGGAAPALRSALEHRRVLASVARTMLACHARGMRLVVVDDLQFADALSLEAIGVVIGGWLADPVSRELPLRTALPLFGCRADELAPAGARLVGMLLGSRRALQVDLAPLSVADVQALVRSLPGSGADPHASAAAGAEVGRRPGLAEALHLQVGGNPAFLLETLRGLWHDGALAWQPGQALALPDGLLGAVRQRLRALSPEALQLAQLAAVAGQDFSPALAASASGRSALALAPTFAELDAAQVMAGTGFIHDLMAEAVLRSVPPAMLQPLHTLVADHLQAHSAPPGAIAHHREAAGEPRAAAPAWRKAAERARADWQMAEAAPLFERAAAAFEAPRRRVVPGTDRSAPAGRGARAAAMLAWRDAARCWLNIGRTDAAERTLAEAAARAEGRGERLMVRSAELTLHFNHERYAEAAAIARELAAELPAQQELLDDDELAHVLLSVALATPYVAEPQALLALIESFGPRANPGSARLSIRLDLCAGMVLNWLGEPLAAQRRLDAANARARHEQALGERINLGNQRARAAELRGDTGAASLICRQTFEFGQAAGVGPGLLADLRSFEALLAALAGDADAARAALDESERLAGAGRHGGYIGLRRARTLLLLGDRAAAGHALAGVAEPAQSTAIGAFRAWCAMHLALASAESPWPDWAAAARHVASRTGQLALRQRTMGLWAAAQAGPAGGGWTDATAARLAAAELATELRARGLAGLERCAHGAAACLARQAGDPQAEAQHRAAARSLAPAVDAWCPPLDDTPAPP
jgi:DNA-binding SARP family transcriptional activator